MQDDQRIARIFGVLFIITFITAIAAIALFLMYKSGLVPRRMAWLGLIGGPLLLISSTGTLFDWWESTGTIPSLLLIPEFIWELSLGIYCAIRGFRKDSPILSPTWRGDAAA